MFRLSLKGTVQLHAPLSAIRPWSYTSIGVQDRSMTSVLGVGYIGFLFPCDSYALFIELISFHHCIVARWGFLYIQHDVYVYSQLINPSLAKISVPIACIRYITFVYYFLLVSLFSGMGLDAERMHFLFISRAQLRSWRVM